MQVIDDTANITPTMADIIDRILERITTPCSCGCRVLVPAKDGTYLLECPRCRNRQLIRKDAKNV